MNCKIFYSFLVLSYISHVVSQSVNVGFCPKVFGMTGFNITKYEGKWYEVEKYWFIFEATASCVNVQYLDKHDGTFAVEINQFERLTNRKYTNPGITKWKSRDGTASFNLDLIITQSPVPFPFRYPYMIIDTDYTSFTIKYYCQQVGPLNLQTMWILSRSKEFSPETRKTVYDTLHRHGLDTTRLRRSDQGSCPP